MAIFANDILRCMRSVFFMILLIEKELILFLPGLEILKEQKSIIAVERGLNLHNLVIESRLLALTRTPSCHKIV
jgi:hypothetical protein